MPASRNSVPVEVRAKAAIAKRRRLEQLDGKQDYRSEHQQRYWDDPAGWVRDCIDWRTNEKGASDYQEEIMDAIPQHLRVCARAPHGAGKSSMAAWIILWFADTRDGKDWKVVTTASAWRQLNKYLWPEVHKWARRLKWEKLGRRPYQTGKDLLELSVKGTTGEAFAVASDNPDLIEGAHADHLLYMFDESKAIPVDTWDSAEGAFSAGQCYWLSISTPGEPNGRFYDIQSKKPGYQDWWVRHVTLEECIRSGRVSKDWATARLKQWGEQSAVYQNRVAGNFATSDEDGIIPLLWVERAIERWNVRNDNDNWDKLDRISVDVGRGGDATVLARKHGMAIKEFETSHERTVMPVTGRVKGIMDANPQVDAVIDVTGIGAGVVDRLREFRNILGRTIAFVAAGKTTAKDKTGELGFVNNRAWAWWTVRELLQDDLIDLPDNDEMVGELTAPKYQEMSGGRIQVEGKDDIRERIGRSTNYADAVIQAFWKKVLGPSMDSIEKYGSGIAIEEEEMPEDIKAYAQGL
jgi:hypothetical protein